MLAAERPETHERFHPIGPFGRTRWVRIPSLRVRAEVLARRIENGREAV
jgi:hypothetical protein